MGFGVELGDTARNTGSEQVGAEYIVQYTGRDQAVGGAPNTGWATRKKVVVPSGRRP